MSKKVEIKVSREVAEWLVRVAEIQLGFDDPDSMLDYGKANAAIDAIDEALLHHSRQSVGKR